MRVGFIGAGNMARAMIVGLLEKKLFAADELGCVSGSGTTAQSLSNETGIQVAASRAELLRQSDTTVLAFKPQHLDTISEEESVAADDKLIISVLAGRDMDSLKSRFPNARNIVRVMPNTPSRIGQGVSAYCFSESPSESDRQLVESALGALGTCHEVEESQMHIVTAVSGCGPAVFFQFIDHIARAASQRGLDRETAAKLAIETGIGSLNLMTQSGQEPSALVDEVVSPNGVTHALLCSLADNEWASIIDQAMEAAVNRSIELSQPS